MDPTLSPDVKAFSQTHSCKLPLQQVTSGTGDRISTSCLSAEASDLTPVLTLLKGHGCKPQFYQQL